MKGTFTYQCQQCEGLFTNAPMGSCSFCGSQAIVSVGWYQLSSDKRQSWLDRIHGQPSRELGEEATQTGK